MSYDGTLKFDTKIDSSGFKSGIDKLGSLASTGLKATGAILGGAATAIAGIGAAAIKAGSEFEAGMSEVQAISGASAGDMEKLSAKAKEMGAKTKFSASESAEAFQYMAMAGWKTGDMLDGIEGIMNLAAASGEDLATTSDIVTDALTAFGLKASDSGHFADILAAASSNANTNVGMLGESFKYVAPVAGALGYSAEDTSVALGLMANSGIKASQAGTSLRAIMTRLVKPTDSSAKAIAALGISVTKSDGSMKSWDEVMGDLRQSFGGLTEAEKAEMAALLAGQEAMSGLLAIVNASDEDFEKLKGAIYDCDGAAKDMADTMNDNLQGQITLLKSALEGLGISLYEEMQEPLKDVVKEANKMVGELQDAFNSGGLDALVRKAGDIFAQVAVKAAEAGPKLIGAAVSLVHSFCDSLLKNRINVGKAGGELITALIMAFLDCAGDIWETIAFLVTEIAVRLSDNSDEIGQAAVKMVEKILYAFITNLPQFIAATAKIVVAIAKALIDNLPEIIASVKAGIKEVLWVMTEESPELFSGKLASFIKGFVEGFMGVVGPVLSGLSEALKVLFGILSSLPPETLEALGKALGVVAAGILGLKVKKEVSSGISKVSKVIGVFKGEMSGLPSLLTGILPKIMSAVGGLGGLAGKVGSLLSSIGGAIGPALSSIVGAVGPALASVGTAIVEGIGAIVTALGGWVVVAIVAAIAAVIAVICNWDAVKEFFTETVPNWWNNTVLPLLGKLGEVLAGFFTETIPAIASKIWEGFTAIGGVIIDFFTGIIGKAGEWIAGMAEKALEFGASFIDTIVGFFSGLPESIWGFLTSIVGKAGEWIASMAARAVEFGASFIDAIVGFFTGLPEKIWGFLSGVVAKVGEWIAGMGAKALELGAAFIDKIVAFFTDLPYKIGYFLGTVIGNVASWVIEMGTKAAELGAAFIDKIVQFFTELPGKVWGFLVDVVTRVSEWTYQMVQKAIETGSQFIAKVVEFFTQLPGKVWDFLVSTVTKVGEWTYQMVQKAIETGTNFVGKVVEFFTQLPDKIWGFLSGAVEKAAQWVYEMAAHAVEAGSQFLANTAEFFSQLPGKVWEFLSGTFSKAAEWASNMAAKALETGKAFVDNVVGFITELPGKIWDFLIDIVNKVADWGKKLWEKGSAAAKSLFDAVVNGVRELPGKMLETGKAIIDGVWDGICKAKDAFVKNVKDFFDGIVDGVKDALGIHSPSKVMQEEVGQPIAAGVAKGIDDKQGEAVSSMERLGDGLMGPAEQMAKRMDAESLAAAEAMAGNLNKLLSTMPAMMEDLTVSMTSALSQLSAKMGEVADKAASSFAASMTKGMAAAQSAMVSSGVAMVSGLMQGVNSASGQLYNAVTNIASNAVRSIKNALGIHSPSKVMQEEVGQWLPPGIGEGFEDAMPGLERQVDAEMASLAGRMQAAVAVETGSILIKSQEKAQHEAGRAYLKGGDTYVEEKIEQTNHYHVPVATPSEVSKANRAAARKLLGGVS